MPLITFKAKAENIYNYDDSLAYSRVKVPAITRQHCNMSTFRDSPTFGVYANSDLFPALLKRALKKNGIGDYINLSEIPQGVQIDTSGFLAKVTIEVNDF